MPCGIALGPLCLAMDKWDRHRAPTHALAQGLAMYGSAKEGHLGRQGEGASGGHQRLLGGAEQDRPKLDCMVKAFERQANDPLHTVCSARRWSANLQGKKPLCAQWLFYFGKWHQHRCENVDAMLLEPHEEQEP